jgi:Chromate transporter
LDAGYFLWNRSIRNSNHRAVGLQANETDAEQGQAPVGDLRRSSSRDSMDFTRDLVAFPGSRRSGVTGQSDAHKGTGRDHKAGGLAVRSANLGRGSGLLGIFLYFAKAGVFVFGSGLAVVPFLYGGVVQEHHWLTDRQFVDAVAVAMITPRPGGHHGCLHWLSCCRYFRGNGCGAGHFLPRLFNCGVACTILQAVGQKSPTECIRPRCNRCGDRGHRRGRDRTGETLHLRCCDPDDCAREPWGSHPLEGAGADFDSLRGGGGTPVTGCLRKGESLRPASPTS